MMVNHNLVGGIDSTPLKNDGLIVSWDDFSIPNMMGKSQNSMVPVTTNQICILIYHECGFFPHRAPSMQSTSMEPANLARFRRQEIH